MHLRRIFFVVWLSGAAALAEGPRRVELFPTLGSPRQVEVVGRVLSADPEPERPTPLERNLRRLTTRGSPGAIVEVQLGDRTLAVSSRAHGLFSATFEAPDGGFPAGPLMARARIDGGVEASAELEVVDPLAPFFVVSDFDDTVAVTDVLQPGRLLTTAFLEDERSQTAVEGMAQLYQCMRESAGPAPGFALVSGSPVQYAQRLRGFLAAHRFPPLGLYLRTIGPGTLSGYKEPVIRSLLARLSNPVVLVGDSGEKDPEVYRRIRDEAPERVKRIYIHDVGHAADPARFTGMVLFRRAADAARDAVEHGLAGRACVDAAFPPVDAADGGPPEASAVTSPAAAP